MKENASIAWLMNIARGKRDMNKLTNEEMVEYAEVIKDFCKGGLCDDCPFHIDDHKLYWEDECVLGVPAHWGIEKVRADE